MKKIQYEVSADRYGMHEMLDKWLDGAERAKFVEGRKSAIKELIPQTVVFQKAQKKRSKPDANPPQMTSESLEEQRRQTVLPSE